MSPQLPPELQVGQPCTWQTKVIKVAALIVQSTRRIIVKIAAHWPWWDVYQAVAARVVAFNPGPALCPVSS